MKKWLINLLGYILLLAVGYLSINQLINNIKGQAWFISLIGIIFLLLLPLGLLFNPSEFNVKKSRGVQFSKLNKKIKGYLIWKITSYLLCNLLLFFIFIILISKNLILAILFLVLGIIMLYYLLKAIIKRDWYSIWFVGLD